MEEEVNIASSYKSDDFHLEYFIDHFRKDEEKNEIEIDENENKNKYSSYGNHKKLFCTNCGKYGHNYKKCIYPITSVGIICISFAPLYFNDLIYYVKKFQSHEELKQSSSEIVKINVRPYNLSDDDIHKLQKMYENIKNIDEQNYDKIMKYLMIQRKHTYSYVELIRGKYDLDNIDYIYNILQYMTMDERKQIMTKSFEELWNDLWYQSNGEVNREKDMNISKDKFELLKSGIFIKKNDINIQYSLEKLMKNCKYKYNVPEWGFPKGRRNIKERNIDCANREFREETNVQSNDYQIVNISPMEELFMGINNVRYKNIYYVGQTCRKIEPKVDQSNELQKTEVGDIQMLTFNQSLDVIREYDIEKRNVILNNHYHLKEYFFTFQSFVKKILQDCGRI